MTCSSSVHNTYTNHRFRVASRYHRYRILLQYFVTHPSFVSSYIKDCRLRVSYEIKIQNTENSEYFPFDRNFSNIVSNNSMQRFKSRLIFNVVERNEKIYKFDKLFFRIGSENFHQIFGPFFTNYKNCVQ